jgi:SAM-dependent methyltransferase
MPQEPDVLDPVDAYDRLAAHFDDVASRRSDYLRGVEALIRARIPPHARRLLDVGAGDGSRALRIAEGAGRLEVVLLEPSVAMASRARPGIEVWPVRAEDLSATDPHVQRRRFDVLTCLWNVLGHIRPEAARARALERMGSLLAPEGRLFVDVNHRYNAISYGLGLTAARFLKDRVSFDERSGDVVARWAVGGDACSTYGHVFTDGEMRRLTARAGLVVTERVVVDYDTGRARRWAIHGNLLYVLKRATTATGEKEATERTEGTEHG